MNGKFLLDTNIVIALLANEIAPASPNIEVLIPSIVLGELYYGAYKARNVAKNLNTLQQLIVQSEILGCNAVTAQHYGQIKNELRAKGRPIPENDIWIAAMARQYKITLVSRDAHFQEVDGITLVKW